MRIEMRPLSAIVPYAGNPRLNDEGVEAVAKSLAEFGWRAPIVVDADGVIVCGHTRYKAALQLGWTEAPVHVATDLTPEQVKAYRIADNQTATLSSWDFELLPIELAALNTAHYDLDVLGFSREELERLLAEGGTEGHTDPDEAPEPGEEDNAVSRPGEVYQLGQHRLGCGDSTDAALVERLMDGAKADLLLCDPPYGVNYTGGTKDALTIANDDLDGDALRALLTAAFKAARSVMKPGASFYIWHADMTAPAFHAACKDAGLRVHQGLVWAKHLHVLGAHDYHYKHEPCLYGWLEDAPHRWHSDRKQTTVLEFKRPNSNDVHPTMKPVDLFAYLLVNSCPPGGVALDIFGGSGTTLIAAEQQGRRAFLMELSPKYCDVIRERWSNFVHGKEENWIERTPTATSTDG